MNVEEYKRLQAEWDAHFSHEDRIIAIACGVATVFMIGIGVAAWFA